MKHDLSYSSHQTRQWAEVEAAAEKRRRNAERFAAERVAKRKAKRAKAIDELSPRRLRGVRVETLATGYDYVGDVEKVVTVNDVDAWGVLVAYGDSRTFLVARFPDGEKVAIIVKDNDRESRNSLKRFRESMVLSASAMAQIKSAKISGIVFETL